MQVSAALKSQVIETVRNVERIYLLNVPTQDVVEELEFILHSLKTNKIKIKCVKNLKEDKQSKKTLSDEKLNNNDDKHTIKKRNRLPKEQNTELCVRPESLDDDSSSTTRNRRTAAQVADQKLTQVHNYMKATKLRRPTDFDEKRSTSTTQSPPPKCRRTRRKQSAGSNSSIEEINLTGGSRSENIKDAQQHKCSEVNDRKELVTNCLSNDCKVVVQRMNTPSVVRVTRTSSKRFSEDLFDDNTESDKVKHKINKKVQSKKHLDKTKNGEHCIALSDPVLCRTPESETEFNGFNVQSDTEQPIVLFDRNTFTKQETQSDSELVLIKTKKIKRHLTQTNTTSAGEARTTEVIEIETKSVRSKTTKNKTKPDNHNNDQEVTLNNMDIEEHKDESPIIRTRTRVIKKNQNEDLNKELDNADIDQLNNEEENEESPGILSRTRVITVNNKKSNDKQVLGVDSEICSAEPVNKSPVLPKEEHSESSEEESNARFRTKTIRKEVQNSENVKNINVGLPASPAPAKGKLVKKRIEDFEKMKNNKSEDDEEEKPAGRLTRNVVKNKTHLAEDKKDKLNRNAMSGLKSKVPSSAEGARFTPLGSGCRPTPDDKVNSALGSKVNRHNPVENATALVQRQAAEEAERKKREEDILKRKAKEEEAKKKKEKTLKASAEETRRKRENRLLKVTAAREAADREKALLAAKAEKEKEEKMLQLQAEKKRQQEEQQRKKLLMQQKAFEHEERRKQEEAARLAKLKEQEEEHKRVLAMKERELELQKQHKAAELRLAEAEKLKHQQQNSKLGKLAAVNNANMKLQQGMTPSQIGSQSYDITPLREDRPLLKPKTENDYGIDDAHSDDSSDEESRPKKEIPAWAQPKNRERPMLMNNHIPKEIWELFMECNTSPDITEIFAGNPVKKRMRTSSAVWRTPPTCKHFQP